MEGECTCKVFTYRSEDIPLCKGETDVKLDNLLCSEWNEAMAMGGVFRYSFKRDSVTWRVLPGTHGLVAQKNPKRFSHRRIPAEAQGLVQPFDPSAFNFNKVNPEEVLFMIQRVNGNHSNLEDKVKGHMMVVNVSPIDYGHVLLVPNPRECLPQVMTEESLLLCLELMALSKHRDLCMVANSLLAYASVNHLHYHFLYLDYPLLARRVKGTPMMMMMKADSTSSSCSCHELAGLPVAGFGLQADPATLHAVSRDLGKIVSLLLEKGIPHNVVMVKGPPFSYHQQPSPPPGEDQETVIRVIVVPRKAAYGLKKVHESRQSPLFFAAACELVGFIPIMDPARYETLTEDEALDVFSKVALPRGEFDAIKREIEQALVQSCT